jgi:hypothetical protein
VIPSRAPIVLDAFGGREQSIAVMFTSVCRFNIMPPPVGYAAKAPNRRLSRVPLDRATPS